MALTLQTVVDGENFYSCNFPEISATSDQSYISFNLLVDGTTALSTRYYTVGGKITVRNLASCIEQAMEQNYKVYSAVQILLTAGSQTSSAMCHVLLCKSKCLTTPVADFIANSFLTTNTHRLITMHGQDVLSFYIAGSGNYAVASFKFNCIARKPDGSIGQYEYVSGRRFGYGVTSVAISATEQQAVCQSQFGSGTQLLSFTLTFNNRVCHFYLVPCPDAKIFRFKNIFGCEEAVAFSATTIAHLETDYSEAMVGGKLLHYDVKHARSYEVQSASLLAHHMTWLEQFLTSSDIHLKMPGGMYASVLIKEYEFAQTDAPGEENTLNFTWIFSDQRETPHRYTYNVGIFTEQFNDIFA